MSELVTGDMEKSGDPLVYCEICKKYHDKGGCIVNGEENKNKNKAEKIPEKE